MEDGTQTGGTSGEPAATPAADSSQPAPVETTSAEPVAAAPSADDDFRTRLRGLDPKDLPDEVRIKLEAPFLSEFNKKITGFDQERQQYLRALERLTSPNGQTPSQDEMGQIRERIQQGDLNAVESLVEQLVQQRTGPQMAYLAKTQAIQQAAQLMPDLPKYEARVAAALTADPALARMASQNDFRDAPMVLAGLAWREKAMDADARVTAAEASVEARVKAGIADYQKKLQGLPPSTSQAGSTPSATTSKDMPSLRDAMKQAWNETVGRT